MKNVTRILSTFLLLTALPAAVFAQGACAARCSPPSGDQKLSDFVRIEADTGRVLGGRTQFPVNTQIQVIIDHQNPFKFSYRYEIEEREIELDIIREALELFSIPSSSTRRLPTGEEAQRMEDEAPVVRPGCRNTPLESDFGKLVDAQTKVAEANTEARQELAELQRILAAYNKFLKTVEKPVTTQSSCQDLCNEAAGIATSLGEFVERKAFKTALTAFKTSITDLRTASRKLEQDVNPTIATLPDDDKQACTDRLKEAQKQANSFADMAEDSVKALEGDVAKLAKLDDKVQEMRKLIQDILDDDNAFVYVDYLEARPSPREWIIKVIRKNRTTGKETTVEVTARAGRSRFSISAGLGFSFIEQQNVVRQQGTRSDGSLGNVFAIDKASDEQVGAVLQLNAAISSKNKRSWGWSLGVLASAGEGGDVGYFTGPTLGLLDNQLFFTLAYHLQDVKTLSDDFMIGDDVPDDLQDPLPTRTDSKGGILVTVTYKIR